MASSAACRRSAGWPVTYQASSACGLTRTVALDYADRGIRVNALAPGPILTEVLQRGGAQAQERAASSLPIRRVGTPEEVAAAAVWLCSAESSFVTGATLTMDGGLLAGCPHSAAARHERAARDAFEHATPRGSRRLSYLDPQIPHRGAGSSTR
jgi:NAD(P)-dependent dehydrogenase (short-subunit alcohol dehydrogenase family)